MLPPASVKPTVKVPGPELYNAKPPSEPVILKDPPPAPDAPRAKQAFDPDAAGKGATKKSGGKPADTAQTQTVGAGADKLEGKGAAKKSNAKSADADSAKRDTAAKKNPDADDTSGKGAKKKASDKAQDKPPKPEEKSKKSGDAAAKAEGQGSSPGPDTVPASKLREAFRKQLEARLKAAEDRLSSVRRERGVHDAELKKINEKLGSAKNAAERQQLLEDRAKELAKQQEIGTLEDLGADVEEAKRLLRGTEKDYFDALTSAAARRAEYTAIKARGVDEVFGRRGPLEVEHIYPRSRIFSNPKFAGLSWGDQVAIFNYEPNLRLMNAEINGLRGNTPYGSWNSKFWSRFPEVNETLLAKLAKTEAEMEKAINGMINDPSTIPRRVTKQ